MIILIPVNGFIANKIKDLQIRQMKNKDERVKLMNEVLNGIKVLKLYAWEPSFENQVLRIREKEIKVLKEAAYLNAGTSFIWSCAPFLVSHQDKGRNNNKIEINICIYVYVKKKVSIVTFATYVMSGDDHVLTVEKAFGAVILFDIIKMPLAMFPLVLVYMVEVKYLFR